MQAILTGSLTGFLTTFFVLMAYAWRQRRARRIGHTRGKMERLAKDIERQCYGRTMYEWADPEPGEMLVQMYDDSVALETIGRRVMFAANYVQKVEFSKN